ncbi:PAS domain-containing protein [Haloglomus litoreum]|uniref:hybrid sensor histidine kinase/response regulator n=1 Tax=Haloglomus litoreum TaxID=3034026 RepID=UPI0023E8D2B3|nr:PAS domain-containing protein [Haloglomus sp. DT116]
MASRTDPIRVLHVDPDPSFLDVASDALESESDAVVVTTATRADEAMATLEAEPVDCVVSDYELPGGDGIELLEAVRDREPELPFVLFTGAGSEAVASEAISAGVTDYLRKGGGRERFALLADRVETAVDRFRSRRALEERNRRLETLISNLPGIVYRCENAPGWPMSYVAGECEELVGYPPEAIEDGEVSWGEDIIHPEDRDRAWEIVQDAITHGEPFELTYRIVDADDDVRWMWERGRAVGTDGTPGADVDSLEGFISDITDRKQRERELREEREFTATVMDAFDDVVYVFDTDGNFVRWNDRVVEVSGYDEAALDEMGPTDFVTGEDVQRVADSIQEIYETGRSTVEVDLVMADGSTVPYELRGRALTDEDGEAWGFCGIARDISERRRHERELESRNERLDEFASIVSHDLRNPLNVAQGHLELAQETGDADHLDAVAAAHERMSTLIEELLELGREGEAVDDPGPVALADVAEAGWRNVDTPGADLRLETDLLIRADAGRLQRLFENLVRNSVEHGSTGSRPQADDSVEHGTPEDVAAEDGGADTEADADDDPAVTVTVGDLPDGTGFYVADDGPGIPPEQRDAVLDAGVSTTVGGTGFGLSIVRRIAEAHGWEVAVTESEAGGARIEFRGVETA